MILQVYKNASDFLEKTQAYLLEDEAGNNLILGLAIRLKQHPTTRLPLPYFATVEKDGRLALAALMTPPNALVLYSPYDPDHEACETIVQDLLAGSWPVSGVITIPPLSQAFAEAWQAASNMTYRSHMQLNMYKLEEVRWPDTMPSGTLCPATLPDIPLIEGWLYQFQKEAFNLDDRQGLRFTTEDVIASHSLHVWVDGGRPVAMAAGRRPTPHGISIAMVYTPPEFRKAGYASACVATLCQFYLDSGKSFCTLFANRDYATANQIYRQIGFQQIGEFTEFRFQADTDPDAAGA